MKIVVCFLALFLQSVTPIGSEKCIGTWVIDRYKVGTKFYPTSKKDKADYIVFSLDFTFSSVSEKQKDTGTWQYFPKKNKIVFTDAKKQQLTAKVHQVSSDVLVLSYPEIKEIKGLFFYYKKQHER